MKKILSLCLISLASFAYSAEWKIVAQTSLCEDKIQILGKEGEKYLKAIRGEEEVKLFPKDGDSFHKNSIVMKEYVSEASSETKYEFFQPGYVEANPPKIIITQNGKTVRCQMEQMP